MLKQSQFEVKSPGRSLIPVTERIQAIVLESKIMTGLCHLFLHHTSASLILCENADPSVQTDLEAFMQRLIPDGDSLFEHVAEGEDDMPAHIRSILTSNFLNIPITSGQLALGTWQGIYLWEHRFYPHRRKITVTLMGE